MKVGNTFVRIGSPIFRKIFFRSKFLLLWPKYVSTEHLNVKSNITVMTPSIFMYNFRWTYFFHPVTSFWSKEHFD
jgi:hypothetical protein